MMETKYESEKKKKKEMVPKRQYKLNQNNILHYFHLLKNVVFCFYHIYSYHD